MCWIIDAGGRKKKKKGGEDVSLRTPPFLDPHASTINSQTGVGGHASYPYNHGIDASVPRGKKGERKGEGEPRGLFRLGSLPPLLMSLTQDGQKGGRKESSLRV